MKDVALSLKHCIGTGYKRSVISSDYSLKYCANLSHHQSQMKAGSTNNEIFHLFFNCYIICDGQHGGSVVASLHEVLDLIPG